MGGRQKGGSQHAGDDSHGGGDDQIHRSALGDQLSEKDGDQRHKVDGQRSARAAQGVGGVAHRSQGVDDKRSGPYRVADGHGHSCALNRLGIGGDILQKGSGSAGEKKPERAQNGADEQGGKQTVGHSTQGLDADAVPGKFDVLPFEVGAQSGGTGRSVGCGHGGLLQCQGRMGFFPLEFPLVIPRFHRRRKK